MKPWHLLVVVLPLSALPRCIKAARVSAGDTVEADGEDTAAETDSVVAADSAEPGDTAISGDTAAACEPSTCATDNGCVGDGVARPGHPCQRCDATANPDGWSPRDNGVGCDDGDRCTATSACAAGACVGTRDPLCVAPPACVSQVDCGPAGCVVTTVAGTCFIDGSCWASGGTRAGFPCQRCRPGTDPLAWTVEGSGGCEDGDACTVGDTCVAGLCKGQKKDCDDRVPCTGDTCTDGVCAHVTLPDKCYIGGVCYAAGAAAEPPACAACDPGTPDGWTQVQGECDDHDECTGPDTCSEGLCVGPAIHVDSEPNGNLDNYDLLGAATLEIYAGFPSGTVDGNLNPAAADEDLFGYGMLMNLLDAKRKPKVRLGDLDTTAGYELCIFARCGVSDISAKAPALTCPSGGKINLPGSFAGCCTSVAGAQEFAATLAASCATDNISTDVGLVRVRVRAISGQAQCPAYTLEWGAVDF